MPVCLYLSSPLLHVPSIAHPPPPYSASFCFPLSSLLNVSTSPPLPSSQLPSSLLPSPLVKSIPPHLLPSFITPQLFPTPPLFLLPLPSPPSLFSHTAVDPLTQNPDFILVSKFVKEATSTKVARSTCQRGDALSKEELITKTQLM